MARAIGNLPTEMYYKMDKDILDRVGLAGAEAMVYSALLYLCKNQPWTGSAQELAAFSRCGERTTALRMLHILDKKGLIYATFIKGGITQIALVPMQNAEVPMQIAEVPMQNAEVSKEKRTKKENYINNNEVSVSNAHAHEKDYLLLNFDDMEKLFPDKIPASTGYYKIIVGEKGYLHPKKYVNEMYEYYNAHGWASDNKLGLMRTWMTRESRMRGGRQPQLSEDEQIYMRTLLDVMDQRVVCRFCDLLERFELTEEKAAFTFPEDKAKAVAEWMTACRLDEKMKAYGRQMVVRMEGNR
ncbi:MAG: hypothetical protein MJZ75_06680 [Paludibacteraceae bacterium]|nr:hypothetical protein [Paludibacteraceae bacterium]